MRQFFTANIARTAACVAIAAILPALLAIATTAFERYKGELALAKVEGDRLVRSIALRQTQRTEVVETLTQLLANLREVREGKWGQASTLFRDMVYSSSEYDNIFLMTTSGRVVSSAQPIPGNIDFSKFTFFKRAIRRNAFSVGNIIRSPFSNETVLMCAMPARIENLEGGVIAVSLKLSLYEASLANLALPGASSLYFLDGSGTLASAFPRDKKHEVGKLLGGEIWRGAQNAPGETGYYFIPDTESDAPVQVTYRKLLLPDMDMPYFYILYARPESSFYAKAKALLRNDLTALGVILLFAIAAALGLSTYTLKRPWRNLMNAAGKIAGGALATRADVGGVGGEIGILGKEFNAMAEALDRRDTELSAARDYAESSRNAKSEFLANMSHEIRTSMNAILGMAYLVLKTELNPQQKGYISKLLSAANALLRVINDILDFSKMEAGKLTMECIDFSLRRIVRSVRSESSVRLGEKKLGFDMHIASDVPDHLLGDPLRLSQALMILVDDAVNRSERGVVTFTCSLAEQNTDTVVLRFEVCDAGVGLTPVQLAEMKELFERPSDDVPATLDKLKLRLAIGNRLIRMMQGKIEVSSVFGEGARFTAYASFGYMAGDVREPMQVFDGLKALIVDPSVISRQDLEETLSRFGFTVASAETLEEAQKALLLAQDTAAPVSVVFINWKPSGTDMPSPVRELKAGTSLQHMPPVILTVEMGRQDLPFSLEELDIDALLPKPINESLVFDTLMNIMGTPSTATAPELELVSSAALAGVRILLAEDNSVNQQIAGEIMESEGIVLTVVSDGEEAVSLLEKSPSGTFDLVLMDLQMPKMDGFTATQAIRSHESMNAMQLPVIAMTAHSDASEISACLAAGMNDHTGKPIIVDKLFATLRRWLPVKMESNTFLEQSVVRIRELTGSGSHESPPELERVLDSLAPHLHEGRLSMLRNALTSVDRQDFERQLSALESMAKRKGVQEEGV